MHSRWFLFFHHDIKCVCIFERWYALYIVLDILLMVSVISFHGWMHHIHWAISLLLTKLLSSIISIYQLVFIDNFIALELYIRSTILWNNLLHKTSLAVTFSFGFNKTTTCSILTSSWLVVLGLSFIQSWGIVKNWNIVIIVEGIIFAWDWWNWLWWW